MPPAPDLGRFSGPALAILTCMADGPKHGYAMIAESRKFGLELGVGTLYGALNRLDRLGLIGVKAGGRTATMPVRPQTGR